MHWSVKRLLEIAMHNTIAKHVKEARICNRDGELKLFLIIGYEVHVVDCITYLCGSLDLRTVIFQSFGDSARGLGILLILPVMNNHLINEVCPLMIREPCIIRLFVIHLGYYHGTHRHAGTKTKDFHDVVPSLTRDIQHGHFKIL